MRIYETMGNIVMCWLSVVNCTKIGPFWLILTKIIYYNCCHHMSDFKTKIHQIRLRLGLRPRPRWGAYNAPLDNLAGGRGLAATSTRTPTPSSRVSSPLLSRIFLSQPVSLGMFVFVEQFWMFNLCCCTEKLNSKFKLVKFNFSNLLCLFKAPRS